MIPIPEIEHQIPAIREANIAIRERNLNKIVASDNSVGHIDHPNIYSIIVIESVTSRLVEVVLQVIANVESPRVVLVTGRNNIRPDVFNTTKDTYNEETTQLMIRSILGPVEILNQQIRRQAGSLTLANILPIPQDHCPLRSKHDGEFTSRLAAGYRRINQAIDMYNKKNGVESITINRFAQYKESLHLSARHDLYRLKDTFLADGITPNSTLKKKITDRCRKTILGTLMKPPGKLKSIVHLPTDSTIGKDTLRKMITERDGSFTQAQRNHINKLRHARDECMRQMMRDQVNRISSTTKNPGAVMIRALEATAARAEEATMIKTQETVLDNMVKAQETATIETGKDTLVKMQGAVLAAMIGAHEVTTVKTQEAKVIKAREATTWI